MTIYTRIYEIKSTYSGIFVQILQGPENDLMETPTFQIRIAPNYAHRIAAKIPKNIKETSFNSGFKTNPGFVGFPHFLAKEPNKNSLFFFKKKNWPIFRTLSLSRLTTHQSFHYQYFHYFWSFCAPIWLKISLTGEKTSS